MRSIFRFAAILSLVAESQHTWADEPTCGRRPSSGGQAKRCLAYDLQERRCPEASDRLRGRCPGDSRKFIVTAAHIYQDGMTLTAPSSRHSRASALRVCRDQR